MATLTAAEKRHLVKANALEDKASTQIERTKKGASGAAGKTILEANIERKKAGLIKGEIKR